MKVDGDDLIFNTGRKVYANNGIVGINEQLRISEGYDGGFEENRLTEEERLELAAYMIDLWGKWRDK